MNSVHIVDKRLHSLVHTAHGAVHGMLQQALVALKLIKRIHDKDYYPTKSLTCVQHPLDNILNYGFMAGHGESVP